MKRDKFGRFIKGTEPPISAFKQGHKPWHKGKQLPQLQGENSPHWKGGKPKCPFCGKHLSDYDNKTCRKCLAKMSHNENNPNWQGENSGYFGIHVWVKRHKGNPKKCSQCGKLGKRYASGRWNIDWANIDHTYKRNLDDYIALCKSCHKLYDIEEGNIDTSKIGNNQFTKH